jgi:hypothetical protein
VFLSQAGNVYEHNRKRSLNMKPIIVALFILLATATAAFGADWSGHLPAGISDTVRARVADAVRAGVDSDAAVALTRRMAEHRFADGHMARAYEIITAAHQEGLPVNPIVNKAYEGMTKGVASERIVQAMETVRSRYSIALQQARSLTADERQRQALGKTMAEGLAAGILEKDLARITENVGKQTRQVAREKANSLSLLSFQVARDMARFGVLSGTVTNIVCSALENSFTAREMERMRNSFVSEVRYGKAEIVAQEFYAQIGAGSRGEGLGSGAGGGGEGSARGGGFAGRGGGSSSGAGGAGAGGGGGY